MVTKFVGKRYRQKMSEKHTTLPHHHERSERSSDADDSVIHTVIDMTLPNHVLV